MLFISKIEKKNSKQAFFFSTGFRKTRDKSLVFFYIRVKKIVFYTLILIGKVDSHIFSLMKKNYIQINFSHQKLNVQITC